MMLKTVENGEVLEGNDRYTGFCKELADKIAHMLGITCKTFTPSYPLLGSFELNTLEIKNPWN